MKKVSFYVAASALILASCSSDTPDVPANEPVEITEDAPSPRHSIALSDVQKTQLQAINDFAFKMWNQIGDNELKEGNLLFSPISMYQVFSMSTNGADGETLSQFLQLLGGEEGMTLDEINAINSYLISELPKVDTSVKCNLLNAGWFIDGLTPQEKFANTVAEVYRGTLFQYPTEDEGREAINEWVRQNTNGMIDPYFDKDKEIEHIELFNVAYFDGKWRIVPEKVNDANLRFHNASGTLSSPGFMKFSTVIYSGDTYKCITLPYGNGGYAMNIVLPGEGVSLSECMKSATALSSKRDYSTDANVTIPMFSISTCLEKLLETIKALGVTETKNFPNLTYENAKLERVSQKTAVSVTEKGVTAAGASENGFSITMSGDGGQPLDLIIDRPFGFTITETSTGAILFMGRVNEL